MKAILILLTLILFACEDKPCPAKYCGGPAAAEVAAFELRCYAQRGSLEAVLDTTRCRELARKAFCTPGFVYQQHCGAKKRMYTHVISCDKASTEAEKKVGGVPRKKP